MGLPIDGFDLGNSPGSFTPERCDGRTVAMTTTNGTRAILASLDADRVLIASFGNLEATSRAARADGRPVHMVCSGTDGQVSWEDTLLAGALIRRIEALPGSNTDLANDEAVIASGLWSGVKRVDDDLRGRIAIGRGGVGSWRSDWATTSRRRPGSTGRNGSSNCSGIPCGSSRILD